MAKKQKKQSVFNVQYLWNEKRSLVVGVVTVFLVTVLSLFGQSNWYKSSLLESSNPFNGTVYPIDQTPNYLTWKGNVKVNSFDEIPSADLVDLPDYTLAVKGGDSDEVKNARLTFPVVYLGDYEGSFKENVGSHLAVDIRTPVGTPVKSIANGVVVKVDMRESGFGHHMCIRHKDVPDFDDASKKVTLLSCYNHMNDIDVQEGAFVFKGDVVGTSGNTGTSTTPHLHFQIDRDEAPWHPWWPFSWAEASSANLTWFDAVSEGLNKDQAAAMTVNPQRWIAQNYSEEGVGNNVVASADNSAPEVIETEDEEELHGSAEEESLLKSFDIDAEKETFEVGESVTLIVDARDADNASYKDYKPSTDFEITSNSSTAEFSKVVNFLNGKTRLVVSNTKAEDFEITFTEGDVKSTVLLITIESEVEEEVVEEEQEEEQGQEEVAESEEVVEQEVEESTQVISRVEFSGETAMLKGSGINIYVELYDENDEKITSLDSDLDIELDGKGSLDKKRLTTDDVKSGKADVRYSSDEAETARITIAGETREIDVIGQQQDVQKTMAGFKFQNEEGRLFLNQETIVEVQVVDKDGEDFPSYSSIGSVDLIIESGDAEIEPSQLFAADFISGKAEITVKALSKDQVIVKARAGVYTGEGKFSVKEEDQDVFSDVSATHENAKAIRYLRDNEIIGGYSDGSFKPNKEVSRIEAVKMLVLGLNKGLSPAKTLEFPDTDNDQWYAPFVGRALYLEMVKGYPDGTFKPAGLVNRAEYYTIMIRAAVGVLGGVEEDVFEDVPAGAWFAPYVDYAKENTITDAQTKFYPSGNVTRAEVAETLYRVLKNN